MVQPFRVSDGDDPGRNLGGWDDEGNVDVPGTLTAGAIAGTGGDLVFSSMVAAFLAVAATDLVFSAQVDGDPDPRFSIDATGKLSWGDGDGAADVTLNRYAAGGLETSGALRLTNGQMLFRSDGSVNLYSSAAGILTTDDTLEVTAGLRMGATGAAAIAGRATLVAGTATVNTTAVTANSIILITAQTTGASPGTLRVSARTAGTSFVISSTSGADTAVAGWAIIEPTS